MSSSRRPRPTPSTPPQDPRPFPNVPLLTASYQKIWTKCAPDVSTPQYVEALVSPATGLAYIKIRDITPSSKPIYICAELCLASDGVTYVRTRRSEVVIKASRLSAREMLQQQQQQQYVMPKRRGADEPMEEVKAMHHLLAGGDDSQVVVPLLDSFVDEDSWLYLVQPFYGQGDLVEVLGRRLAPPAAAAATAPSAPSSQQQNWARSVFLQLVDSLSLLKKRGVAHMDISPENFFVKGDGVSVALGDFGMALYVGDTTKAVVKEEKGKDLAAAVARPPLAAAAPNGTVVVAAATITAGNPPATPPKASALAINHSHSTTTAAATTTTTTGPVLTPQRFRGKIAYTAPELMDEKAFDPFKADVFSLGCTLFAILTGRLFLEPSSAKKGPRPRYEALLRGDFVTLFQSHEHQAALAPLAADLIRGMVQPDPQRRLTLEQVQAHPWCQFQQQKQQQEQKLKMGTAAAAAEVAATSMGRAPSPPVYLPHPY